MKRMTIVLAATIVGYVIASMAFTFGRADSALRPASALTCRSPAHAMTRLEMLFGSARPNGLPISDEEWTSFVDTVLTPRFADGLTVLRGTGKWRGRDGTLANERSNIVVVWYVPNSRSESDIEAIRSSYRVRFDQESVIRVESISCVSF